MGVLISGGKQYLTLIKSTKYSPCFPLYIQLQPKVKSKVSQAIYVRMRAYIKQLITNLILLQEGVPVIIFQENPGFLITQSYPIIQISKPNYSTAI
jgi:hypothetical protein